MSGTTAPTGTLSLQTIAMPADTNPNGDIFGGWVLSQMDLAASIHARRIAKGRVATVHISNMSFLKPVPVGSTVSCYTELMKVGHTSMRFSLDVWCTPLDESESFKVTEGEFVFVAIDDQGKSRAVPK
ncbi:acyl-CoA thioesterase [Porticoccus sp. W117]|uniref:acyl-CoA thioesterase n=1 Tax=Porticoccus sp. W117 TaxID=3054777 RepID=UPI002597EC28|nr:acyl-CoA thioesterase [Porticoccus sp. W117]MDM3870415.1 acyl-CoA thioesterase [Porticoccus sp. W117]